VRRQFAALLLAAALLAAGAGCAREASAVPDVARPASTFGGTDLAWIEINIAMNDQVLPLLALVPDRGDDPTLTELSAWVHASATTELTTLRRLHDLAGLPPENPHEGMLMPGLVPADAVARAAELSGPPFDQAVRDQLDTYLQQGRRLARGEQEAGTDPETRALATRAATTRDAALRRLAA